MFDDTHDEEKPARKLAGADLVLRKPASIAARWDVAITAGMEGCRPRALAAALGMCWPRFHRRYPYQGNALAYGGHVIDTLTKEGASFGEILAAGAEASELCVADLPAVDGAADFSEPPVG
jgi:hypothetical protein